MRISLYLDNGLCVHVWGRINPGLTEEEFVKAWNKAQPGMVHKVVKAKFFQYE